MSEHVIVIGGGLAGTEAAWQLAERGIQTKLYEMRPKRETGAHVSNRLGELVCSNSLGSKLPDRATGLLQYELRMLKSLLLDVAQETSVPAGGALAVDREKFAQIVTEKIEAHPNITLIREEVTKIPQDTPTIIATGPLTSPALAKEIEALSGQDYLYFYDAISPIVEADTIDMDIAFHASRYDRGDTQEGDYINCPMNKEEYDRFVEALQGANIIELRDFEKDDPNFFEGCIPIEQLASRGHETLRYGPMRAVGLDDPRTGRWPYAVVQLRRDNLVGSLYNIVGFQTNLKWNEQREVLRLIPGLENAMFARMGQMHRNTFINAPTLLNPTMQYRHREDLYFAGQITGMEGYMGNVASGLLAALNLARQLDGQDSWIPPQTTMLGALCYYITHAEPKDFQPMKANFGIIPDLPERVKNRQKRKQAYVKRALADMKQAVADMNDPHLVGFKIPEVVFSQR
ncbi:MAG: methylenetetrahydrofolate--tRNA-(uracil(54)-C(5))-methyltransferase (FADH(2)-oxidizing) TrmFO [Chloroflexota bacterium]